MDMLLSYVNPKHLSKEERLRMLVALIGIAVFAAIGCLLFCGGAFASGTDDSHAATALNAVVIIICNIVRVVGAIFVIVGVVKFVISHANEQGPEQQKAILMIATGIVLIVVPTIITSLQSDFNEVITDITTNG